MTDPSPPLPSRSPLHDWLRRLRWSLAALPERDRDDIVAEARAHLEERVAGGEPPERALAAFGPPEAYARQFVDEMELAGALGDPRSGTLLAVVARRVHRSLLAVAALVVVTMLGAAAFMFVTVAIMKVTDPTRAGLWRSAKGMFLGIVDDPSRGEELLGWLIFPLAALGLLLTWGACRLVLLVALRMLARGR